MQPSVTHVYLGLGSNLGDRGANFQKAMIHLEHWGIKILRSSTIYETEPVGLEDQPWFYNMAVCAETALGPEDLLKAVKSVENGMGRQVTERNGPRKIDIDILFYGGLVVEMDGLTIPHARLHERNFVLIPLEELAPELVHPVQKKSIKELLKGCGDKAIVRPIS